MDWPFPMRREGHQNGEQTGKKAMPQSMHHYQNWSGWKIVGPFACVMILDCFGTYKTGQRIIISCGNNTHSGRCHLDLVHSQEHILAMLNGNAMPLYSFMISKANNLLYNLFF